MYELAIYVLSQRALISRGYAQTCAGPLREHYLIGADELEAAAAALVALSRRSDGETSARLDFFGGGA